jgi:hypothetical protein
MDAMALSIQSIARYEKKKGNEELATMLENLAIVVLNQYAEIERMRGHLRGLTDTEVAKIEDDMKHGRHIRGAVNSVLHARVTRIDEQEAEPK